MTAWIAVRGYLCMGFPDYHDSPLWKTGYWTRWMFLFWATRVLFIFLRALDLANMMNSKASLIRLPQMEQRCVWPAVQLIQGQAQNWRLKWKFSAFSSHLLTSKREEVWVANSHFLVPGVLWELCIMQHASICRYLKLLPHCLTVNAKI